jgi:hypothetical protein
MKSLLSRIIDKCLDVQLKKKTEELKAMVSRLGELVVRRNPELAGWAEQQREKYDGLPFQLDEIRPSPVVDAYRNKCEFRVGKQSMHLILLKTFAGL